MRVAASEAALQASAASFGRAEAGTLEFPAEAFKMLIPGLGSFQGKVRPECNGVRPRNPVPHGSIIS